MPNYLVLVNKMNPEIKIYNIEVKKGRTDFQPVLKIHLTG